jgi:hypothetical protein
MFAQVNPLHTTSSFPSRAWKSSVSPAVRRQWTHCASRREAVVGIDLGTTNSAVAYVEGGKPVCIPNCDGETTTPSVVAVLPEGEVLIGTTAKRQAVVNPTSTYYSVKRIIGSEFKHVQKEAKAYTYNVRPPRCATNTVCIKTGCEHACCTLAGRAFSYHQSQVCMQVDQDEEGAAVVSCSNVGVGHLYPEEVAAQVRLSTQHNCLAATCPSLRFKPSNTQPCVRLHSQTRPCGMC